MLSFFFLLHFDSGLDPFYSGSCLSSLLLATVRRPNKPELEYNDYRAIRKALNPEWFTAHESLAHSCNAGDGCVYNIRGGRTATAPNYHAIKMYVRLYYVFYSVAFHRLYRRRILMHNFHYFIEWMNEWIMAEWWWLKPRPFEGTTILPFDARELYYYIFSAYGYLMQKVQFTWFMWIVNGERPESILFEPPQYRCWSCVWNEFFFFSLNTHFKLQMRSCYMFFVVFLFAPRNNATILNARVAVAFWIRFRTIFFFFFR